MQSYAFFTYFPNIFGFSANDTGKQSQNLTFQSQILYIFNYYMAFFQPIRCPASEHKAINCGSIHRLQGEIGAEGSAFILVEFRRKQRDVGILDAKL